MAMLIDQVEASLPSVKTKRPSPRQHMRKDSGNDPTGLQTSVLKGAVAQHETRVLHRHPTSPALQRKPINHLRRHASRDAEANSTSISRGFNLSKARDWCPGARTFQRTLRRRFSLRLAGACLLLTVFAGLILQVLYVVLSSQCIPPPHLAEDVFSVEPMLNQAPTVEYYVHGRGRGHASRGKTMVTALRRHGYRVCVFVDSGVAPIIDSVGQETIIAPSMPVGNTVMGLIRTITTLLTRVLLDGNCDICNRRRAPPDVIITDGDFPGAWRASRAGVPAVAVGHGYLFSTTERPAFATSSAWDTQHRLNQRTTGMAKCTVGVSFVDLRPLGNTTIVARPTVRQRIAQLAPRPKPTHSAVVYFRDPDTGLNVHAALAKTDLDVRAFGPQPTKNTSGLRVRDFDEEDFITSLAHAKMVVGTSGDNLIAECMTLGIPMLAMYNAGDTEQQLNAEMLEQSGYGRACSFQAFNASVLAQFTADLALFKGTASARAWQAPDAVEATLACVQQVSPRARAWHASLAGVDDSHLEEVIESRRQLLQGKPNSVV